MKNICLLVITGALITVGLTTQGQTKSAAQAKKEIKEADIDRNRRESEIDSAAGFKEFKKNAESQVSENSKKLAVLKGRTYGDNKDASELMIKRVVELEKRNSELTNRINGYATTQGVSWSSFKRQFAYDMNQLIDDIKMIG